MGFTSHVIKALKESPVPSLNVSGLPVHPEDATASLPVHFEPSGVLTNAAASPLSPVNAVVNTLLGQSASVLAVEKVVQKVLDLHLGQRVLGGLSEAVTRLTSSGWSLAEAKKLTSSTAELVSKVISSGADLTKQTLGVDLIVPDGFSADHLSKLTALGLKNPAQIGNLVSGSVSMADLHNLLASGDVLSAAHVTATRFANGPNGGEAALKSTEVNNIGFTGKGVVIGLISDSFATLSLPKSSTEDYASGELIASNVTVLSEGPGGHDEGRAMAQIIRDTAPDAKILFHSALTGGTANMAANILDLASRGARVIVDDIRFSSQLTFANDVINEAINQVAQQGVIYVTANGNDGAKGVIQQTPIFRYDFASTQSLVDFNENTQTIDPLLITANSTEPITLRLTWSSNAPSVHQIAAQTDLDFFVVNVATQVVVARSLDDQSAGQFDPVEILTFTPTKDAQYAVFVNKFSGTQANDPEFLQINAVRGDVTVNTVANGVSSAYGQSLNVNAIGIGAVDYKLPLNIADDGLVPRSPSDGPAREVVPEPFTTQGGGWLVYNDDGVKLDTPQPLFGAEFASVDGVDNSVLGVDRDGNGLPNFFGTSAAAASIAGVVALMLEKNPSLDVSKVNNALVAGSHLVGDNNLDRVGFGLVNAFEAVGAVRADTTRPTQVYIDPSSGAQAVPTNQNFTLYFTEPVFKGAGNIVFSINGSPAVTIPVSDAAVSFMGSRVIINPPVDLKASQSYTLSYTDGAFVDASGLKAPAFTGYTFKTEASALNGAPTAAADSIIGSFNADSINGLAGNDTIFGGLGDDTLLGGSGDDALYGQDGDDTLEGGLGNDTLDGGQGLDTVSFRSNTAGAFANLGKNIASGPGNDSIMNIENIDGSDFDDTFAGSNVQNLIRTFGGNDKIYAYGGDDIIDAGAGDDLVQGGAGADLITGGIGNDSLYGEAGDDVIDGGAGADLIDGGDGNDTVSFQSATGAIFINIGTQKDSGADGVDTLVSIENVRATRFDDIIAGSNTNNRIESFAGNDSVYAYDGNDIIDAGAGNDVVYGGKGNDQILGGSGNDALYGEDGNDFIDGGDGNDTIDGGAGQDTVSYFSATSGVFVNLGKNLTSGQGADTLVSIENIWGSSFNDIFAGSNEANLIVGNQGDDAVYAYGGNDTLLGGTGADTLDGGVGNDFIEGGDGNDTVIGGAGVDELVGGSDNGMDTFVFNALSDTGVGAGKRDVIRDFGAGDKIDLSAIDANPVLSGNQAFTFIGSSNFTAGTPGQVRFAASILQIDLNGDALVDAEIELIGVGPDAFGVSSLVL